MIRNLIKKILSVFKNRLTKSCRDIQSFLIAAITEKWWLLDWVPTSKLDAQSLMLVRLDVIGDFVLWLDSARVYRQLYPGKKIVLYANSSWVELAEHLPYWDEVVSIDMVRLRKDEFYRLKTFYRIRRRGFTIAIQPTYSREYMGDMLVRASGAEKRIAFDSDLSNIDIFKKNISDQWFTELIQTDLFQMMELKRNAEFVRALGAKGFVSDVPQIGKLKELPESLSINEPYAVIFPGASWAPKMWPASHFAELMRELQKRFGLKLVLCGGAAEYALCQQVIELSGLDGVLNFGGKTKLSELVEVIRQAKVLFASDTSAIHIAAATTTSSVCVLGGGHYGRFLPYEIESTHSRELPSVVIHIMNCFHCNWSCIYLEKSTQIVPCVNSITVESVLKQYQGKLIYY